MTMSKIYGLTEINKFFREQLKKRLPEYTFSITRGTGSSRKQYIEILKGPQSLLIDENASRGNLSYNNQNLNEEGKRIVKILREIDSVNNWDNSDISTDYFDVNYYTDWSISKDYVVTEKKNSGSKKDYQPKKEIESYLGEKLFDENGWSLWKSNKEGKIVYNLKKSDEVQSNKEKWTEIQSEIFTRTGFKYFGGFKTFSKWGSIRDERGVFDSLLEILKEYYPIPNQSDDTKSFPMYKVDTTIPKNPSVEITIKSCKKNLDLNKYWFPLTLSSFTQFNKFVEDNLALIEDDELFVDVKYVASVTTEYIVDLHGTNTQLLQWYVINLVMLQAYENSGERFELKLFQSSTYEQALKFLEFDDFQLRSILYQWYELKKPESSWYIFVLNLNAKKLQCFKKAIPVVDDFDGERYPVNPFIVRLTLLQSEGEMAYTELQPVQFSSFRQLTAYLKAWFPARPEDDLYDKHWFYIETQEGVLYPRLKLDVRQCGLDNPESPDFINNFIMADIIGDVVADALMNNSVNRPNDFFEDFDMKDWEVTPDEIKKIIAYYVSTKNFKPERTEGLPTEEARMNLLKSNKFIASLYSSKPTKERILAQIAALEILGTDKANKQISALKLLL